MSTQKKSRSLLEGFIQITSVARRRLVKPHKNFEQFTAPLLQLYKTHIGQLRIIGLDPATTLAQLHKYEALAADEAAAEAHLAQIRDARLQLGSSVWSVMLEIYARVRVFSRTDPTLKQAIADFEAFMKSGPHRKAVATA